MKLKIVSKNVCNVENSLVRAENRLVAGIGLKDTLVVETADAILVAPLAKALRCEPSSLRIFAAQELARLRDPLAAPALMKRAIYDKEKDGVKKPFPVTITNQELTKEG